MADTEYTGEPGSEAQDVPAGPDTGDVVAAPGIDWGALEARLAAAAASASLPSYRRIWFASLIRQGREAESTGRAALAAHCQARLEKEFAAFGIPVTDPDGAPSGDVRGDVPESSALLSGTSDASAPGAPRAARKDEKNGKDDSVSAAPRAPSPLEALAARRDVAARARLRELLDRHAARLSPDEAAVFAQALSATDAEARTVSVADLRRRLVDRLMRAARYRRHAARLAAWSPAPPPGVAGPYNDYRTLEEMLHRVATANPHAAEWAAEFLDIYAEMRAVRQAYGTLLPGK